MTFDLTPAEHTALRDTGEARVVRKCEPQPNGVINGHPGKRATYHIGGIHITTQWSAIESPLPPAGTREVIPDIGPCVWGEGGCKQRGVLKNNEIVPLDEQQPTEVEAFAEWVWVGHIRKEERA